VVINIKKKCPECGSKAVKLYQNKSIDRKRAWIPTAWHCTKCGYTYNVAADTLMYKNINPKHGKQKWVSMGWYCTRCKYVWMDKKAK